MSNVEAAASLFGPPDSTADLFVDIGENEGAFEINANQSLISNDNAAEKSLLHNSNTTETEKHTYDFDNFHPRFSHTSTLHSEDQGSTEFYSTVCNGQATEKQGYYDHYGQWHNYEEFDQTPQNPNTSTFNGYDYGYTSIPPSHSSVSSDVASQSSSVPILPSKDGRTEEILQDHYYGQVASANEFDGYGSHHNYDAYKPPDYAKNIDSNNSIYDTTFSATSYRPDNLETHSINSYQPSMPDELNFKSHPSQYHTNSYNAYDPPIPSSKSTRAPINYKAPTFSPAQLYESHSGIQEQVYNASYSAQSTNQEGYTGNGYPGVYRHESNVGGYGVRYESLSSQYTDNNSYQELTADKAENQFGSEYNSEMQFDNPDKIISDNGLGKLKAGAQEDKQHYNKNGGYHIPQRSPKIDMSNGVIRNLYLPSNGSSYNSHSMSLGHNDDALGAFEPGISFSSNELKLHSPLRSLQQDGTSLAALIPLPVSPQEMPRVALPASGDSTVYLHSQYQYPSSTSYADITDGLKTAANTHTDNKPTNQLHADKIPISSSPPFVKPQQSSVLPPAKNNDSSLTSRPGQAFSWYSSENGSIMSNDILARSQGSGQYMAAYSNNAYTESSVYGSNNDDTTSSYDTPINAASNIYSPSLPSGPYKHSSSAYNPSTSPSVSLKSDRSSQSTTIFESNTVFDSNLQNNNFVRPMQQYSTVSDKDSMGNQEMMGSPSVSYGSYIPSPSLLGTNDPLMRAKIKVPIMSFGFGGKLVTCFHTPPSSQTGFDVALSVRRSTDVRIHHLQQLMLPTSPDPSNDYPGPLLGDPGPVPASIVRTSTTNSTKTKKAKVVAYLERRIETISQELGYIPQTSPLRQHTADKLILIRLLKIMLENDGQLIGSPHIDAAVRDILLGNENSSTPAYFNPATNGQIGSYQATALSHHDEVPIAVYSVRNRTLDRLQNLLLRGEKRQAYQYALDERMWAHAMVISSSLDKESFQAAVNEFIKAELGLRNDFRQPSASSGSLDHKDSHLNGRETLRVAYSLFSGQASAAVQELLPQKHPSRTSEQRVPLLNNATLVSPEFPSTASVGKIAPVVLSQWRETASVIFSGQMGLESSFALTSLGDYLIINDWTYAAHCCYLLSPKSSPIGGIGAPSSRITLLGFHNPQRMPLFYKDPDFVVFTEIAEFALTLHSPVKGQEAFSGFPHLQSYRLIWAEQLAENGDLLLSKRYCEAIAASMTRSSPYYCHALNEKLRELSERLTGESALDKSGSWIGSRITKPNLDSIGGWLGKGLSRFVAGEGDSSSSPLEEDINTGGNHYSGAFTHFSTISSTDNSIAPSPSSSVLNVNAYTALTPQRTLTSVSSRPIPDTQTRLNRAASAMDYYRPTLRENSPGPRVSSASAATTSFSHTSSNGALDVYDTSSRDNNDATGNGQANGSESLSERDKEDNSITEIRASNWWDSAENSNDATPVATTFYKLDAPTTQSSGFLSLMDDNHYQPTAPGPSTTNTSITQILEEEEELGLSNPSTTKKVSGDETRVNTGAVKEEEPTLAKKPDLKASGSWFGRWWGRGSSTPGPVKASLGEETSFYYDKDLKKWVNKKTTSEGTSSTPPPPPPTRAQTASPSRTTGRGIINSPGAGLPPPPVRPASAAEVGTFPPRKQEVRKRSNLVPAESNTSLPPSSTDLAVPIRPKSSATKRGVRNRYVDVLQQ